MIESITSLEFFAGVMTGLALGSFIKAMYKEVLSRAIGVDRQGLEED